MGARSKKQSRTTRTTMRLTVEIMEAARKKAERLGLSRTQYVEALVRKDLGMEAVDTNADLGVLG